MFQCTLTITRLLPSTATRLAVSQPGWYQTNGGPGSRLFVQRPSRRHHLSYNHRQADIPSQLDRHSYRSNAILHSCVPLVSLNIRDFADILAPHFSNGCCKTIEVQSYKIQACSSATNTFPPCAFDWSHSRTVTPGRTPTFTVTTATRVRHFRRKNFGRRG